jgi:hypothetical protein
MTKYGVHHFLYLGMGHRVWGHQMRFELKKFEIKFEI